MMNQTDLSILSNAVMHRVQEEFKRQNIWMGSPLRMSWQRDPAMQCYFFILSKLDWNIVVKVRLDDNDLHGMGLNEMVHELAQQVMAGLLLNGKDGDVRRGHSRG